MKWSEVYSKSNNKKFSVITNIKEPLKLQANFSTFFKAYKVPIIVISIIFIVAIVYTYRSNISIIFAALALILLIMLALGYYNSYKIQSKNKKLIFEIEFKKTEIDYKNLITIYISRSRSNILFFIPIYIYNLHFVFLQGEEQMMLTLSTIMANNSDVYKFFKHIDTEVLPQQKEEEKRIKDEADTKKALIITSIIVIAVALIIGMIIVGVKGIK